VLKYKRFQEIVTLSKGRKLNLLDFEFDGFYFISLAINY